MNSKSALTPYFIVAALLLASSCGNANGRNSGDAGDDASLANNANNGQDADGNNGNNGNNGNDAGNNVNPDAATDDGGDWQDMPDMLADADMGEDADLSQDFNDGPEPVILGSAGNYVILAKSGVSTTGATAVVGNIGLSPADSTYITGFALSAPPTTFTTSDLVTGQVFAANYDDPTPANLTAAVSAMEGAYTDAAGRTLPDFTELGAGNIDGLTLVPGLYKWGTGVEIPIGVTLEGDSKDVWIFQIAENLIVGNGAMVTLAGGAQAENVFWQVAGQVTLGTTSDFKGIILSQTLIEMNTGAIVLGRALAQTAVTLDATAITQP